MITAPVAIWVLFNILGCVMALAGGKPTKAITFGLTLGVAALSCALLSSGALHLFLGMEITLWIFQSMVVLLALGVRPPGSSKDDLGSIAVSSSIRLAAALGIWLWV
jgi:hypothetical protein